MWKFLQQFVDSRHPQCDVKSCNVALFLVWFRAINVELVVLIYARFLHIVLLLSEAADGRVTYLLNYIM